MFDAVDFDKRDEEYISDEEGHPSSMKLDLHIYLSIKLSPLKQFVNMRLVYHE